MKRGFFLLAGLVSFLCACDNSHDDMYDAEWVREQYENQWKMNFGDIDPNQNFNMATQIKANLTIVEDALSEYTFKIYTANPLFDDNALLMAKTTVTTDAEGRAETSIAFDAVVGQQTYYVVRVNSHGRRLIKALTASNGVIDASFGFSLPRAASRAAEMGALPTMEAPYTEAEVNKLIAEGHDLKNGETYMAEWGQAVLLDSYYKIALATGNENGSFTTVISDTRNSLGTYDTGYYTKGEKVTFEWLPDVVAYKAVWNQITELGTVKVVIASGGVLNYNNSGIANLDIIVAAGGTLNLNGTFDMGVNSRLIVMPGGKVVDNTTYGNSLKNNDVSSLVYNAGTIENIRSYLQNSGTTYIAPEGVLTGEEISFQNDNCVLTNWGKVDVKRITGNGKQGTINNACLLRSDEIIQVLFLNQAPSTAVECNEIHVNHVTLRENSLLRSKHLDMNGSGSFIDYVGASGSSALVSALWFGVNNANTKITGSVYVEAGEFESVDDRYAVEATAPLGVATVGEADFAIFPVYKGDELKESDCTGGGNIPDAYVPDLGDESITWRLACEDLGSVGDYDFNDIVFDVTYVAGDDTAYVKPVAAGGTLRTHVCNRVANMTLGEIHELFGFDDITLMINTGVAYDWNGRNGFEGKTIKMKVPTNYSVSENMGGFYLLIENGNNTIYDVQIEPKESGNIPQMICVPSDWRWPTETVNIGLAYPDFGLWGQNYGNGTWYNTVETEYVY